MVDSIVAQCIEALQHNKKSQLTDRICKTFAFVELFPQQTFQNQPPSHQVFQAWAAVVYVLNFLLHPYMMQVFDVNKQREYECEGLRLAQLHLWAPLQIWSFYIF